MKNGLKYGETTIVIANLKEIHFDINVDKVKEIVNSIYGDACGSVAHQLRMYFNWEYEDVVYYNKEL